VDIVVWLIELKFYTRVRRKFIVVYPNQAASIYRSVMRRDKVTGYRFLAVMENNAFRLVTVKIFFT